MLVLKVFAVQNNLVVPEIYPPTFIRWLERVDAGSF